MKTGNIQIVFRPSEKQKEKNYVKSFKGRLDLIRKLWQAYKSGCYKFYVFFDNH